MTASKNDKTDVKPAMQFVNPRIWMAVRDVEENPLPHMEFALLLLDLINECKAGTADINDTFDDILVTIASRYGRSNTMRSVGLAMRAGEIKYGDWNFLKGHGRFQLLAAMERHALLILDGELMDKDTSERLGSNVSHFGCIVAGINMIWYQDKMGTSRDDGPLKSMEFNDDLRIESKTEETGATGTSSGKRYRLTTW